MFIVDEAGKIYLTPEMESRIQFSSDVQRVRVNPWRIHHSRPIL